MNNILEKINKTSLKFLVPLSLEETYKTIVKEAIKLIGAEQASLFIALNDELIRVASEPAERLDKSERIKPRKRGFTYRAYKERRVIEVNIDKLAKVHPEFSIRDIGTMFFIPLSYHGKSIGTLNLFILKGRKLSEEELHILEMLGSYASLAIKKAQYIEETRQALETRDLFISMASHELRTPLTAVNGYIQLLMTRLGGKDSVESKWMNQLVWESQRLTYLIKELLEIERIKGGDLEYNWMECRISLILEQAISNFRISYPDRVIELENCTEGNEDMIIGDQDKLLQVFSNILDNAVESSSPNSSIYIQTFFKKPYIYIKIRDFGRGIPKAEADKIFDIYYRGTNNLAEGMGLGMFIAKNITVRHHGLISLNSKLNKGTTVELKFPVNKK